jgi:hypothetical protein
MKPLKEGRFDWDDYLRRIYTHPKWMKRNASVYDEFGYTALHTCIIYERQHVPALVDLGVDLYPKTKETRQSILHLAVDRGNTDLLNYFLSSLEPKLPLNNNRDANGDTPLHLAARRWRYQRDARCFHVLAFHAKTDMNMVNSNGERPLDILLIQDGYYVPLRWTVPTSVLRHCIVQGAWFGRGRKYAPISIPLELVQFRRCLANCRLSSRALAIALRKSGFCKDLIPLVVVCVEETRELGIWTTWEK